MSELSPRMRKEIELTENLAVPAYGPHGSCSPDTRAVSSTALNNLHGSWFGKRIAQQNVERLSARSLEMVIREGKGS